MWFVMDDNARPELISTWVWLHHEYEDLDHWQQCLVAACNADAKDYISAARVMYIRQGGRLALLKHKRVPPEKPTKAQKRAQAALEHVNKFRAAGGLPPLSKMP